MSRSSATESVNDTVAIIKPVFISDTVLNDSDDPAIWINFQNPGSSLVLGTDKGGDFSEGGLHVFNLQGEEIKDKRVGSLKRPNNFDVAYGLLLGGVKKDVAICTERNTNSIRVFTMPDMTPVDNGGIPVFENDSLRAPMGIAIYSSPQDKMYVIVGRKSGPTENYLWQYEIKDDGKGNVKAELVRKFGNYSGEKEIESIAVDNEPGYVYYSDEGVGIRKYYAHPDSSNVELALFARTGFTDDHEGISIYKTSEASGYILVSDQAANQFQIFPREGSNGNPNEHPLLKTVKMSTNQSDGSEVTSFSLPGFPAGLFVAMSDNKTFQFYKWEQIAGEELKYRADIK
jgi:3-phytase